MHISLCILVMIAGLADSPPAASRPPAPQPRGWQELRSVAGGFRMEFPGSPVHRIETVPTEAGSVDVHGWTVGADWGACEASFGDVQPSVIQSKGAAGYLRDVLNGQVARGNGSLLSESAITVSGHPAREVLFIMKVDMSSYTVRARAILAGSRLYQLIYMTGSRSGPDDAARFLNSFRLLDR